MYEGELQDRDPKANSLGNRFTRYLGEFVYGAIDGAVTTFAVVAGGAGAHLDSGVIIVLGFANLIADGFSMSVGAYLSAKSRRDLFEKSKRQEYWEIENIPESEVEEIRQIYREKGFEGELLEQVVGVITADKDRWVDTMMKEELKMIKDHRSPFMVGLMTFLSFLAVGLVPLIIYLVDYFSEIGENLFVISGILTGIAFVAIGFLKAYVAEIPRIRSILETVFLGASAAALAYFVGSVLEKLFLS